MTPTRTETTHDEAQCAGTDAGDDQDPTPRALDTVHVDGLTGLFHSTPGAAGDHATAYSRRQATLAGYEPCPTCFSGAGGDDA